MKPFENRIESKEDAKNEEEVVENPFINDVLIECCSTLRSLCVNNNDCKTVLGARGICKIVTKLISQTDHIPLLENCFRLIIDLSNTIRTKSSKTLPLLTRKSPVSSHSKASLSPTQSFLSTLNDNNDMFGESGICEAIRRVLLIHLPSSDPSDSPAVSTTELALQRSLLLSICDAIATLSGSKFNCVQFAEADVPTVMTQRMKGNNLFCFDHIRRCSFELWCHWLWAVIRLSAENRARNKTIFIEAGAAELIFSVLQEFMSDLDTQLQYDLAQKFLEYSSWAVYNIVYFRESNLQYIADNISFAGPLLRSLLALEEGELGKAARGKVVLLFEKLQIVWPFNLTQIGDEEYVGPSSNTPASGKRSRSSRPVSSKEAEASAHSDDMFEREDEDMDDKEWQQSEYS